MKSVSISELPFLVKEAPIDCCIVDDVTGSICDSYFRTCPPGKDAVVMQCARERSSDTDAWTLSHDVFKSLEKVLTHQFPHPKLYRMLLWTGVLDRVYPHVWDELRQVYNVEFLRIHD